LPDADAVVIFDIGRLKVTTSQITLERHVRTKVFRKDVADDVTSIEIPYYDGDKLKGFKAHTITPDGERHDVEDKFKKEDDFRRVLTFAFPAVTDGCMLEYKYKQVHERYSYLDPWYFQGPAFTILSRFSVELEQGFTYNAAIRNLPHQFREPAEEEIVTTDRRLTEFTWEATNLPPARDEPLVGAIENYLAALHFQLSSYRRGHVNYTFIEDWSDLGNVIADAVEEFTGNPEKLIELTPKLTPEGLTEIAKARATYNYVRDEIENRDDEMALWENDGAEKILERGYGRAIHKNLLLVELMRSRGLQAYPLLVATRDYVRFNPSIHQLTQFNHILCYVRGEGLNVALDAGECGVPFPNLPPYDLVDGGLLIDGESSEPIELTHPRRESGTRITSIIDVHEDGSAICSTSIHICGHQLTGFSEFLTDSLSRLKVADKLLENSTIDFETENSASFFDAAGDSLRVFAKLSLPGYAEQLGEHLLFSPCSMFQPDNQFEREYRLYPVDFRYPRYYRQEVDVRLPDQWIAADPPADVVHRIGGASYTRRTTLDSSSVLTVTSLEIGKQMFSVSEYPQLRELYDIATQSSTEEVMAVAIEETE
jgi:transglutaminase-like putative cysteine protease